MDTICLLQIAHAVIFDVQLKLHLELEEKNFVNNMLRELDIVNKNKNKIMNGEENQPLDDQGEDFIGMNSAQVLRNRD